MNARRMEAEVVRDSVLAIAGKLDTDDGRTGDRRDQRSMRSSAAAFTSGTRPTCRWTCLRYSMSRVRTSAIERSESIVPQQALALANSKLSFTISRLLAQQLSPTASNNSFTDHRSIERQSLCMAARTRSSWLRHSTASLGAGRAPQSCANLSNICRSRRRSIRDRSKLTPFTTGPESAVKPAEDPAAAGSRKPRPRSAESQ